VIAGVAGKTDEVNSADNYLGAFVVFNPADFHSSCRPNFYG
jgi:hypothetical protein